MAIRRRIGRRRVIDPGVVLLSASNLLSELECFPPSLDLSDIERYIVRVEAERRNLRRLHDSDVVERRILNRIIQGLKEIKDCLEQLKDHVTSRRGYSTPRVYTGRRGQPPYYISSSQLEFLIGMQFTVPDIARLLGVSTSTVIRHMRTQGIRVRDMYSNISDRRLDQLIRQITMEFPSAGYRLVQSHLRARGYRLTERRVRSSLGRVDPSSVAVRWTTHNAVHRRVYSVPHPNALWHIDGNMSLIRWGFVVHGAIDGYSRLVVYLHCSSNNEANTVLDLFIQAGETYGYPSRVRSDQGVENVDVARLMFMLRGRNRGSHITGRSVNNIRIERLWRDVFSQCLSMYYHLFYYMEDNGILDPSDVVHLYALHYIYIVRINSSLASFTEAWNGHPLRTSNNSSPSQLWIRGMLRHGHEMPPSLQGSIDLSNSNTTSPPVPIEQELQRHVNPSDYSDTWGIDLYIDTLQFLFNSNISRS